MKINKILLELINEDFKSQLNNFVRQGYDNNIVKDYIEKFKYIRDKKFQELYDDKIEISVPLNKRNDIDAYKKFHELETIVDYVSGQRQGVSTLGKENNIEVDAKPIYEDDNYIVYYADTPRACIKYKGNIPYSWCVARSDSSNMFYTYRFKPYQPAFYFIKNKKLSEKEFGVWNMTKNVFKGEFKYPYHFFVIQVPKNVNKDNNESNQYIVTSANNDGDKQMSLNDIIKITKPLTETNLKKILTPKPLTYEESKKIKKFKNGISDYEFEKLTYEEKRDYLDIYPTIARPITDKQFKALPKDLLNLYVSFGIGLSEEQYNHIKNDKSLLKRYQQISKRKLDEYFSKENDYDRRQLKMSYTELIVLDETDIKKYLETISEQEKNRFVIENGIDKFEFLTKYLPDFEKTNFIKLKNIIIKALNDDENSIEYLEKNTPESISVGFTNYGNSIVFESYRRDIELDSELETLFSNLSANYFDYDSDYFDGAYDSLKDAYDSYITSFVSSNTTIKNDFILHNLSFDAETIKDLLETFNKKEEVEQKISEEYNIAEANQYEDSFQKIKDNFNNIIEYSNREITIDLKNFLVALNKDTDFFTTNDTDFYGNLNSLILNILEQNNLPSDYSGLFEDIISGNGNFSIDDDSILNEIEWVIEQIFSDNEEFFKKNNEEEKKLKSQHIKDIQKILTDLKLNPNNKVFENNLVKIELFWDTVTLDGKVEIKMYDKVNKKTSQGLVNINNLASHFTNYKLFETKLIRLKILENLRKL
jgi:hypothetical protein